MYGSVLAPAVCTAIHQNGREPHDQGNKEQDAEERRVLVAAEALALTLTHYAPLLLVHAARIIDGQSDNGGEARRFLRWSLLAHDLANVLATDEDLAHSSAAAAAGRAARTLEAICLYTNDALRSPDGQLIVTHPPQPMADVIPSLVQWASNGWSRSVEALRQWGGGPSRT